MEGRREGREGGTSDERMNGTGGIGLIDSDGQLFAHGHG